MHRRDTSKSPQNIPRISLSFHFSSEQSDDVTSDLDSLARLNIFRLRTFLATHEKTGEDVLLIGFADGKEGATSGEHIAQQRAVEIATSLRAIGVIVPSQNILNFDAELARCFERYVGRASKEPQSGGLGTRQDAVTIMEYCFDGRDGAFTTESH